MIFQDPAASLDPRQSIGKAIEEVFDIHTDYGPQLKKEKTLELLDRVGLKAEQYDILSPSALRRSEAACGHCPCHRPEPQVRSAG